MTNYQQSLHPLGVTQSNTISVEEASRVSSHSTLQLFIMTARLASNRMLRFVNNLLHSYIEHQVDSIMI